MNTCPMEIPNGCARMVSNLRARPGLRPRSRWDWLGDFAVQPEAWPLP